MINPLCLKSINDLLGQHFYIPYYQRGYRWTSQQVNDLLNDVWAFANKEKDEHNQFYCLQPIVVKSKQWLESERAINGWEVIDGQQRLTTMFIIISYLANEFLKVDSLLEDYGKEIFSLRYETREKSEIFLKNIRNDNSNSDYYHIGEARNTINEWFTNGKNVKDRIDKNKFLDTLLGKIDDERSVQVIWYMVESQADSIELFTRLNIGKIPLTNAELIKALFLSSSSFKGESADVASRRKMEISQMWDEMEQMLSDAYFWSFITNAQQSDFTTKIELLFDMIASKSRSEIDPLFTFLYFLEKSKDNSQPLWKLWLTIEHYYQTLCEWYKDKNLYHKIGYLITVREHIGDLINLSMNVKKNAFEAILNKKIQESLNFDIEELSYDNNRDYRNIENLLLLFNVESIRSNQTISEFYPFKLHKNTYWSLEHIHAQNSESMDKTKKDSWFKWLRYHQQLINELIENEKGLENLDQLKLLSIEIKQYDNEKLTWEKFSELSEKIIEVFSETSDGHSNDLHSISNLALLSQPDNAALNNSVFEVKRREIIKMDKNGSYIPLCTKRVFLKYYNDKPSTQQYHFWGKDDRDNYLKEIRLVLRNYLPKENMVNAL